MHIGTRSTLKICWRRAGTIRSRLLSMTGNFSSRFSQTSLETFSSTKQRIYWKSTTNIRNGCTKRTRCSSCLLRETTTDWNGVTWASTYSSSPKESTLGLPSSAGKGGSIISILPNSRSIGRIRRTLSWFSMLSSTARNGPLFPKNWAIKGINIQSKIDSSPSSPKSPKLKCALSKKRNWLIASTPNIFRAKRKKLEAILINRKAQTLSKHLKAQRKTQITLFPSFRRKKMNLQWEICSKRIVQAAGRKWLKSSMIKIK